MGTGSLIIILSDNYQPMNHFAKKKFFLFWKIYVMNVDL
jgi:hypothetical protein